jgi:hypothetical protein
MDDSSRGERMEYAEFDFQEGYKVKIVLAKVVAIKTHAEGYTMIVLDGGVEFAVMGSYEQTSIKLGLK